MRRTFVQYARAVAILTALLAGAPALAADMTIKDAANRSKQTGLPMFVMFGGPQCRFCVEMKKRLQTEPELTKLITEQFVFTERQPSDADSKELIEHYKIKVEGIPHVCIISAKGELVKESRGAPQGDDLKKLLLEGIEKTGGFKKLALATTKRPGSITKLTAEELADVLQKVADAKSKLESDETMLDGVVELMALQRTYVKINDVKKETSPALAQVNKDKSKAELLVQARMLDSAAAAVEAKKTKVAQNTYKSVIAKYPDSAAAKMAQSKLDELTASASDSKPKADAQSSTNKAAGGASEN